MERNKRGLGRLALPLLFRWGEVMRFQSYYIILEHEYILTERTYKCKEIHKSFNEAFEFLMNNLPTKPRTSADDGDFDNYFDEVIEYGIIEVN